VNALPIYHDAVQGSYTVKFVISYNHESDLLFGCMQVKSSTVLLLGCIYLETQWIFFWNL
jgi:hypothetical protein